MSEGAVVVVQERATSRAKGRFVKWCGGHRRRDDATVADPKLLL